MVVGVEQTQKTVDTVVLDTAETGSNSDSILCELGADNTQACYMTTEAGQRALVASSPAIPYHM